MKDLQVHTCIDRRIDLGVWIGNEQRDMGIKMGLEGGGVLVQIESPDRQMIFPQVLWVSGLDT